MRFRAPLLPTCLLGLVVLLCLPLVLHRGETNYTWDETNYYLPAIMQMRTTWPAMSLKHDSLSATAPGYPYLLAGVSLVAGQDLVTLRLANLAVSLVVLVLLWSAWDSETDARVRFAALAPLAMSNFYIKSASNVVTDNPTLLAVSGSLVLALATARRSSLPWGCVSATLAVFFRQNSVWLEAPLALRALFAGRFRDAGFLLLPAALLGMFILVWGGLVPPAWQAQHGGGITFSAGAYQLALLALMGPFYYAAIRPDWRRAGREPWAWAGLLAGLILVLAGPNTPSHLDGRWGGYLWEVAARLPAWADRSVLFVFLTPAGGFLLGLLIRELWREAGPERASIWLGAQLGFMLVGLANRQVYHRYFEPTQLVLLVLWLSLLTSKVQPRYGQLLALAAGQTSLTLATAHGRTFGFF